MVREKEGSKIKEGENERSKTITLRKENMEVSWDLTRFPNILRKSP